MIGAVILAAGYSSRMGSFKPLLEVEGVPSLARAIRCMRYAGVDETAVITGHNKELLEDVITGEGACVREVFNPDYNEGMFTSVRMGVRYFKNKGADGLLLMPADYPLIPSSAIRRLLVSAGHKSFAVPVYKGEKGHPLWIPSCFFDEILSHGGNMGLKGVTQRYESEIQRIEMPYEGVVLDMDEHSDYEKILARSNRCFNELAAGRRFILLRHGETATHAGKVFIGKYDVPLSEEGVKQAGMAAGELLKLRLSAKEVYCGSLIRARATANIIAAKLNLPVCIRPELNEMALGSWDGRMIEDIKKEFPAEYQKRGDDILKYKLDTESENFYDLQYRVSDCLITILSEDNSRDIIIVSHSGVIKCLYGSLHMRDIEWAFSRCSPKKGELTVIDRRRAVKPANV